MASDVGISLSHLAGTKEFSLYCTEIGSMKIFNTHYHEQGVEFYQIISGIGIIHIGESTSNSSTIWRHHVEVKQGDFFMIQPKQTHTLENLSEKKLVVVFGYPKSYITDDRVMVEIIRNTRRIKCHLSRSFCKTERAKKHTPTFQTQSMKDS